MVLGRVASTAISHNNVALAEQVCRDLGQLLELDPIRVSGSLTQIASALASAGYEQLANRVWEKLKSFAVGGRASSGMNEVQRGSYLLTVVTSACDAENWSAAQEMARTIDSPGHRIEAHLAIGTGLLRKGLLEEASQAARSAKSVGPIWSPQSVPRDYQDVVALRICQLLAMSGSRNHASEVLRKINGLHFRTQTILWMAYRNYEFVQSIINETVYRQGEERVFRAVALLGAVSGARVGGDRKVLSRPWEVFRWE
jgi:hypothetical protein